MACFYSLCVSPCLFFIPSSSSSHSAINPNSHLSDQREGWSFSLLIHLQFAHRRDAPVSRDQRARSALRVSGLPARWALRSCCLNRQAGRTRGGWASPPAPHVSAAWVPDHPTCLHVPLAGLPCWGGWVGMVHGTRLGPAFVPRPGRLSAPGGAQKYLWAL